jgi:hypothetical protein
MTAGDQLHEVKYSEIKASQKMGEPAKMKMDVIADVFPALIFKDAKCTPVYPHRMLVLSTDNIAIASQHQVEAKLA